MRLEAVTSWRNEHFPARPCYLTDGKFILTPWTLTGSDAMLAALELCEDDGWMAKFADLKGEDKPDLRERMRFVHDYPLFAKARAERNITPGMPMRKERFFFCDPENAIVAAKDGEKILYIECHWRAREAPNGLAKIHYIAPDTEVQATVACEETFEVATTGGSGVPPLERTGGSGVSPFGRTGGSGVSPLGAGNNGLGLGSMRRRTEELGGTFSIESEPGRGTVVRVTIPFDGSGKEKAE